MQTEKLLPNKTTHTHTHEHTTTRGFARNYFRICPAYVLCCAAAAVVARHTTSIDLRCEIGMAAPSQRARIELVDLFNGHLMLISHVCVRTRHYTWLLCVCVCCGVACTGFAYNEKATRTQFTNRTKKKHITCIIMKRVRARQERTAPPI